MHHPPRSKPRGLAHSREFSERGGSRLVLACVAASVAGAVAACSADPIGTAPTGPSRFTGAGGEGTGGAGGVAGVGGADNHGEELFADLEADLVEACAACHDAGGVADSPLLAGPDRYASISTWPGVIVKDAQQSVLVTWPRKGGTHSGTNLDADALEGKDLARRVTEWLEEEALGISDETPVEGAHIEPFAPILGFNSVYLDALGKEYEGMSLSFHASELTDQVLQLGELQIHPTAELGLHVVHPLFVVYPVGAEPDPDPVDSCSNVDQTFAPGESAPLGPGVLVLANWEHGAKLSIAFEQIDPSAGTSGEGGGGATGGCKDVASFVENAVAPLMTNCSGCHGGNNPNATAAVDMSKLVSNAAAACAQVKNRVSPDSPAASQIFVTTDPGGNAAHPYKFAGNAALFGAFKASVSIWIAEEK